MPETTSRVKVKPYDENPDEEYMGEGHVRHFREILLAWRRHLLEEARRTVHHLQDEPINLPDLNDRASHEEEVALELVARERERKLIGKIDEALRQLVSGNYGYCEVCGEPIGIRRLEARPTATLCLDCKEIEEYRERQRA